MPGTVRCQRCGDAGFVKRDDLPVAHPDFGGAVPCPECEGARKARNPRAENLWFLERDRAERERLRPCRVEQDAERAIGAAERALADGRAAEGARSRWSPPMPG